MPEWIMPSNRFSAKLNVACFQGTGKRLMPDQMIREELLKRLNAELLRKTDLTVKTAQAPTIENDFMETVETCLYVFTETELQELINKIIEDERRGE